MGVSTAAKRRFFASILCAVAFQLHTPASAKKAPEVEEPIKCSEEYAELRDEVRKRDADTSVPPALSLAEAVLNDKDSGAELQKLAGATCKDVSAPKGAFNVAAFLCIGDSNARSGNRVDAYCAYQVASELTQKLDAGDKGVTALVARAEAGRAGALQGSGKTDLAIEAYKAAIAADKRPEWVFALGKAHLDLARGGNAEHAASAETTLLEAAKLGASSSDVAVALVTLAKVKQNSGAKPQAVLPLLEKAREVSAPSVAANGALGIAYFELERFDDARTALTEATKSTANDSQDAPGLPNYRAEAYYYLSLVGERTKPVAWDAVVSNAVAAATEGGAGNVVYRRQACLASIAAAKHPQLEPGASVSLWCDKKDSAEAQLFRGMYFLRRAQALVTYTRPAKGSAEERAWIQTLEDARKAFQEGLASNPGNAPVPWAGSVPLTDLLNFGVDDANYMLARCRTSLTDNDASKFFGRYFNAKVCDFKS